MEIKCFWADVNKLFLEIVHILNMTKDILPIILTKWHGDRCAFVSLIQNQIVYEKFGKLSDIL